MKKRGRQILRIAGVLALVGLVLLAYSYFIEPRRLVIVQQTLPIKGWDPALDGFKIVAIGDVHAGSNDVDENKLKRIVELTNEQNPDLIVLLGDYVSQRDNHDLKMPLQTVID